MWARLPPYAASARLLLPPPRVLAMHVLARGASQAVKRFRVTNMVESSAIRDLRDASMYEEYTLPKMYRKMTYCVGCAIHQRVVRGRSKKTGARKDRTPPMRPRQLEQKFSKDKERENRSAPANIPGNTPAPAAAAAAAPEQTA